MDFQLTERDAASMDDDAHQPAHRIIYVRSPRLAFLSQNCGVNQHRSLLVHALIEAYGLLQHMKVLEDPKPATIEQLRQYHHDMSYLAALVHYSRMTAAQLNFFGLVDDCSPFPNLYEHACLMAGGSLAAADGLCSKQYDTAIHLDGGRHHAKKSKAEGFCYVNDVVLAILRLLDTFQRILYIDLDIHHGDGVEEAFASTNRVLTLSIHKHSPGFFPCSNAGRLGFGGEGAGSGFALNLPLQDNLHDDIFTAAVQKLAHGIHQRYRPDCIVIQCGVDGLANDPIAQNSWSLTPLGYAKAVESIKSLGLPMLVLGGGGYCDSAAACAWTAVVATLIGKNLKDNNEMPDDIPDHEYFDRYSPTFSLSRPPGKPSLAADKNDPVKVEAACDLLLSGLEAAIGRIEVTQKEDQEKVEMGGMNSSKRTRF